MNGRVKVRIGSVMIGMLVGLDQGCVGEERDVIECENEETRKT